MPLGIALKNRTSIIVAADHADPNMSSSSSRFITLPNRSAIVISGNRAAVEPTLWREAFPKVKASDSTAAVAQYIHAALLLEIVPNIAKLSGRTEILIGGIDPIRHTTEPDIYYLDSAKDFFLTIADQPVLLTGSTAVAQQLIGNTNVTNLSTEALTSLAKECFTATRLRWPSVVAPHLKLAVISPDGMQVQDL